MQNKIESVQMSTQTAEEDPADREARGKCRCWWEPEEVGSCNHKTRFVAQTRPGQNFLR